MKVYEYRLNAYYKGFLTIEADDLTDSLKESIQVNEDDCYALCTAYCSSEGEILFAVMSIGSTWENCVRGIENPHMLGIWDMDQVAEKEARIVEPNPEMIQKKNQYIEAFEDTQDDEIEFLRSDERLDDIRNVYYPDIVTTIVRTEEGYAECDIALTKTEGPFLIGILCEEIPGHDLYEEVKALPFYTDDGMHLFSLFVGEGLSKTEEELINQIQRLSENYGVSYRGNVLRS